MKLVDLRHQLNGPCNHKISRVPSSIIVLQKLEDARPQTALSLIYFYSPLESSMALRSLLYPLDKVMEFSNRSHASPEFYFSLRVDTVIQLSFLFEYILVRAERERSRDKIEDVAKATDATPLCPLRMCILRLNKPEQLPDCGVIVGGIV